MADDLSPENPQVLDVLLNRLLRQAGRGQVKEERHEVFDDFLTGHKITVVPYPALRSRLEIATVPYQRGRWRSGRISIRHMLLTRVLNQCHHFPGFVCEPARFSDDGQSILIPIRPRKRSRATCSGCQVRPQGRIRRTGRGCFNSLESGGARLLRLFHAARRVRAMRSYGRRGSVGAGQAYADQNLHALPRALSKKTVLEGNCAVLSHHMGQSS